MRSLAQTLGLSVAMLALIAAAACEKEQPMGTPEDWRDDAQALLNQGDYFREDREQAPLGALEYYKLCLEAGEDHFDQTELTAMRQHVQWLSALKLVLTEDAMGKADYQAAIKAMSRFRRDWPESAHYALALFYRALAKEYDLDYQNPAGAIEDYRQFIRENPDHSLVPEARVRIGHCYEFDIDAPDYQKAVEEYDHVIHTYGPEVERSEGHADTVDKVDVLPMVMAVERALYNKARILEDHVAPAAGPEKAKADYATAAECYRRLMHPRFFGTVRFKQSQFVHFRYGVLLAEQLGRTQEGIEVLKDMEKRWPESPWYGSVRWKREQIEKTAEQPAPTTRGERNGRPSDDGTDRTAG
jgi:tetratricopeptide (TPR) repeat protein